MPYEVVDEIFELCKRVWHETKAFVSYDAKSYESGELCCGVYVDDNGFDASKKPYDGSYMIICSGREDDICYEIYKREYENCKAHLERLLKDGVVGV